MHMVRHKSSESLKETAEHILDELLAKTNQE